MGIHRLPAAVSIADANSGETAYVEHNAVGVIGHGHPDQGSVHFYASGLSATQDFILIDLSDTTNYPHANTTIIHIDYIAWDIDATTTPAAAYMVGWGFLDGVDATDGDFYHLHHVAGTRTTGLLQENNLIISPNGWLCDTVHHTTGHKSLNDAAFQTDVNLASTIDTTSIDTPSGSGDIVVRAIITAGTIDVTLSIGYHTHSTMHPA